MKRVCFAVLIILLFLSGCPQPVDNGSDTNDSNQGALDANALDTNQPDQNQDQQELSKCADLNGHTCEEEEACFKDFLPALDTNICCPIKCVPPPKVCSDGTTEGNCSSQQPYYCNQDGELVIDCSKCSCSNNKACDAERGCIERDEKPKIVRFEFTYEGEKFSSGFEVVQGSSFGLEIGATDDKGLVSMYLDDNSFGNAIENEVVSCQNRRLCFQTYSLQETVAGTNTYTLRVVDSSEQETTKQITVTISSSCGNEVCETWENYGNCPADCEA